ncbi:hypothetical protein IAQ61_010807 [Plenodomus lingam]|uniref:uncharacterized protein n=1 Tax=Leptosphaeria maculans TaxID=5022 RepID=UPI003331BD1C|nr:hypothetical protein IAQ61_010807 [Plenodomus lingam]
MPRTHDCPIASTTPQHHSLISFPPPRTTTTPLPIEHLEDFTAHEWCNSLLSDPTIPKISKRHIPDPREGVSNTFFTRTLFTPTAIRAFLSLYRPGSTNHRDTSETTNIVTGSAVRAPQPSSSAAEAARQLAKRDISYAADATDVPETLILVSIGSDVDGGVARLHGGVTASLLDQVMGSLVASVFGYTCATSELKIKYLRAVRTPCVLLVRRGGGGRIKEGEGKVG